MILFLDFPRAQRMLNIVRRYVINQLELTIYTHIC